jgi:hypothetical protein
VLKAGIVDLSSGGRRGRSRATADGKTRNPPRSDQIAAASTGNITNKIRHTSGHANKAKYANEFGSALSDSAGAQVRRD